MSDHLKLENQLCHRFYLLSNAFTRAYRPLLDQLDITYPQYIVLMALWEKDNITLSSLTEKTGIDAGALTQILKKLSSKSLLAIEKSDSDKRVKYVQLTPKGNALKSDAAAIPPQMFCKFNDMSPTEIDTLMQLLDKLNSSLQAES